MSTSGITGSASVVKIFQPSFPHRPWYAVKVSKFSYVQFSIYRWTEFRWDALYILYLSYFVLEDSVLLNIFQLCCRYVDLYACSYDFWATICQCCVICIDIFKCKRTTAHFVVQNLKTRIFMFCLRILYILYLSHFVLEESEVNSFCLKMRLGMSR